MKRCCTISPEQSVGLLFLFITLLSACSKTDKDNEISTGMIVGTWYFAGAKEYFQPGGGSKSITNISEANLSETLQFRADGSYIYNMGIGEPQMGIYKSTGNSLYLKPNDPEIGENNVTVLKSDQTMFVVESKEIRTVEDEVEPGTYFYEVAYKKK